MKKLWNFWKKGTKETDDLRHWRILADVFLDSIRRQDMRLVRKMERFFYSAFQRERDAQSSTSVKYPYDYYKFVFDVVQVLSDQKSNSSELKPTEYRSGGSLWLLGEHTGHLVSDETYFWMWQNLKQEATSESDRMTLYHWENATQFYSRHFGRHRSGIDWRTGEEVVEHPSMSNEAKSRFTEFHDVLGALNLYLRRYSTLRNFFEYTQSHPPNYPLLPDNMTDVFKKYNQFRDRYELNYPWIGSRYSFPGLNGMKADYIIKDWITKYIAILFLRQYSIVPHLITMAPLDFPVVPDSQREKREWIDNIPMFRSQVSEMLSDRELLSEIGLNFITPEWCRENGHLEPLEFMDEFRAHLVDAYEQTEIQMNLDQEKINLFFTTSLEILTSTISQIQNTTNEDTFEGELDGNHEKMKIGGSRSVILSKDSLSEQPQSDHLNFDSFLATALSDDLLRGLYGTFMIQRNCQYLLRPEDILRGVENLSIDENYLVVNFGVSLAAYAKLFYKSDVNLISRFLRGADIVEIDGVASQGRSLFILKKEDLPTLSLESVDEDRLAQYDIEDPISEGWSIYGNVIDLNENNDVRESLTELGDHEEGELRRSVLLILLMNFNLIWKKSAKVIEIMEYSEIINKGAPTSIDSIKDFQSTFS